MSVKIARRVISQATVVAIGVTSEGDRQVLGVDVGASLCQLNDENSRAKLQNVREDSSAQCEGV